MSIGLWRFMRVYFGILLLAHNVSSQYYYNGTVQLLNSIESILWSDDQYITYKMGELYVTESLQNNINGKQYEIYRSHLQPMSDNIEYFYTKTQDPLSQQKQITFFNRDNQPLCWLDSNDIDNNKIQTVLINGQNIFMLQNRTKIRIHTLENPNIDNQDNNQDDMIPDCLHQRYNWTNKDNEKYDHKQLISLQSRNELVITYYDHIQVLSENDQNQFQILQTIDFTQNSNYRLSLYQKVIKNQKPYEVKYFVNDNVESNSKLSNNNLNELQEQLIVIIWSQQLWVYHRLSQQLKFSFVNNIRLNQTILSLQIISSEEAYVLVKDDCSVYKVPLVDQKKQPLKIASYSTLCTQTLLKPLLKVRKNNDVVVVAVQKVQQKQLSYQQLIIYLTPVQIQARRNLKKNKMYQIPLKYKQTLFSLVCYQFIPQSDFIYLLLRQSQTRSQLFIGFQISNFDQNEQKKQLQWQWISDRFQNGVQEYSIGETGIIVVEYNPLQKIQQFTWYETTLLIEQFVSKQPIEISRIKPIAFYQNAQQSTISAYDFVLQEEQYKLNSSNKIYSNPSGNFTIQVKQNELNQIQVYVRQNLIGTIEVDHEINLQTTQLQFMNDSIIIELIKVQEQDHVKSILNAFLINFQQQNHHIHFQYTQLQSFQIPLINPQLIKINQDNIVYLNSQQAKIILLNLTQKSFQIQQEIQLTQQKLNPKQIILTLSHQGNIYSAPKDENYIHQWVYCYQYEQFQNGQCLHKPIGPDPNPFFLQTLITALIACSVIIFITLYQIIKSRSFQRRPQLERNLLQQQFQRNPHNDHQQNQQINN